MNIKVILLFITINMLLFSQYLSLTNNNILVNIGEGRVDYTTYTIYADATADFVTDTRLHPEALLILQQLLPVQLELHLFLLQMQLY